MYRSLSLVSSLTVFVGIVGCMSTAAAHPRTEVSEAEEVEHDTSAVQMSVIETTPLEAFDEEKEDDNPNLEMTIFDQNGNPSSSGSYTRNLTSELETLSLMAFDGQTSNQDSDQDKSKTLEEALAKLLEKKLGVLKQPQSPATTVVGYQR